MVYKSELCERFYETQYIAYLNTSSDTDFYSVLKSFIRLFSDGVFKADSVSFEIQNGATAPIESDRFEVPFTVSEVMSKSGYKEYNHIFFLCDFKGVRISVMYNADTMLLRVGFPANSGVVAEDFETVAAYFD